MNLQEGEEVVRKIEHANVRLRGVDWARVPFMFLFVLIGLGLTTTFLFSDRRIPDYYTLFFGIYCTVYASVLLYKWLYVKRKEIRDTAYVFTNRRLIIYLKSRDKIKHSFDYSDFPEFTYWESPYNNGHIVIGSAEEFLVTTGRFPFRKTGINLADHEIVLENLDEVKKEYDFLKTCIEQVKNKR